MEEKLRRYAQMRRQQAGGPFELHSADKEALLAEARRVHEGRVLRRPGVWAWWTAWAGPRWAMAAALVVVLGLGVFSWWRAERPLTGAPEKTLAFHKPPEGTVARKEADAMAVLVGEGQSRPADTALVAAAEMKAPTQAPADAAGDKAAVAMRRAVAPAADLAQQIPVGQPQSTHLAEATVEMARAEETVAKARVASVDRAAAQAEPPLQEVPAPASVAAKAAPKQETTALPTPALARRAAPGGAGAGYGTLTAPPPPPTADAARSAVNLEAVKAPAAPTLEVVQSLTDFYLAQQAMRETSPGAARVQAYAQVQAQAETRREFKAVPGGNVEAATVAAAPAQVVARTLAAPAPQAAAKTAGAQDVGLRYVVISDPAEGQAPAIFHLWTSNEVVRVVDADGTVYLGRFVAAALPPPPEAVASQQRGIEKAGARELLTAQTRRDRPSSAAQDGAAQNGAAQGRRSFEVAGQHPRWQQEVRLSGEWPPGEGGVLRLQLRVGNGPVQSFLARPAEN